MATNQDLPTIPRRRLGKTELSIPCRSVRDAGVRKQLRIRFRRRGYRTYQALNLYRCEPLRLCTLLWGFRAETRAGDEGDPA